MPNRARNLRSTRYQLNRSIRKLEARIVRYRERIAAIEAELASLPLPIGAPRVRGRSPHFRRGELLQLCLAALTTAGAPVAIRELARAVLVAKGLDAGGDAALIESVMRPLRNALSEAKALGRVRLVGVSGSRSARWEIVQADRAHMVLS
jgi:hypothetical protein